MDNSYSLLSKRFKKFKEITGEEGKIIDLICQSTSLKDSDKVLDIGSNEGLIAKSVQPNYKNITLVDIENFNVGAGINFLNTKWENADIPDKFDLIIASHVWGHFHHVGTTKTAFDKAVKCLSTKGKLILCYNSNNGFMELLIDFCKTLFQDFVYDIFDESLFLNLKIKKTVFNINLEANSFEKLANLLQVLIIMDDNQFENKKSLITNFLKSNLEIPKFDIEEKFVLIEP